MPEPYLVPDPDPAVAAVFTWPVDSSTPRVQRLFDRGMTHAYGHEWDEANRLLRKAIRLDSSCALCYWGLAYAARPATPTVAMSHERRRLLALATQHATAATPRDRALIAVSRAVPASDSVTASESAALRLLHVQWPLDATVTVLYAEALLREAGWNAWDAEGLPRPTTVETLRLLESVLERHPDHPGAQHLYIHIMEAQMPDVALDVARRLASHPSPVRHLRFLPARIYLRVGRYHDASLALNGALDSDGGSVPSCEMAGMGGGAWHYGELLWSSLVFEGRGADARDAARRLAHYAALDSLADPENPRRPYLRSLPLLTLARFGDWERVARQPEPSPERRVERSIWQFVQGVAAARMGARERLAVSLEQLQASIADSIAPLPHPALPFMEAVLAGEEAALGGFVDEAQRYLGRAVLLQDSLDEGALSPFYRPARHILGDILLAAARPEEAERIFEEDLAIHPENGWALWGLYRSLQAQQRHTAARIVLDRFNYAWQWADVSL